MIMCDEAPMAVVVVMAGEPVKHMGIVRDHTDTARYLATGWEIPRGIEMYLDEDGYVRVSK